MMHTIHVRYVESIEERTALNATKGIIHTSCVRNAIVNSIIVQGRGQSGVPQDVFIGFYLTELIRTLVKRRTK